MTLHSGLYAGYHRNHKLRLLFRVDGYDAFDHTRLLVELSGHIPGQIKESEVIDLQPARAEDYRRLEQLRPAMPRATPTTITPLWRNRFAEGVS
jgi:hypothetical protein